MLAVSISQLLSLTWFCWCQLTQFSDAASVPLVSGNDQNVRIIHTNCSTKASWTSIDWTRIGNKVFLALNEPASKAFVVHELRSSQNVATSIEVVTGKVKEMCRESQRDLRRSLKFLKPSSSSPALMFGSPLTADDVSSYVYSADFSENLRRLNAYNCEKDRGQNLGFAIASDVVDNQQSLVYSALDRRVTLVYNGMLINSSAVLPKYNYFGYAVAARRNSYAASSPRARRGRGLVELFTASSGPSPRYSVNGSQVGGYFGYSVAVTNRINGTRTQLLLVGSPLWFDTDRWIENAGAVEVFACAPNCQREKIIKPPRPIRMGRFGTVVAAVDINQDGFDDLVVGEPGNGTAFMGAIHFYLYEPHESSISSEPHQSVYASDFTDDVYASLFGLSVAVNQDVDNNGFPDILTSLYHNRVLSLAILRTRPIVPLEASISVNPSRSEIDFDVLHNCSELSFSLPGCVAIKLCLTFKSDSLKKSDFSIMSQLTADVGFSAPRVTVATSDRSKTSRLWQPGAQSVSETLQVRNRQSICRTWFLQSHYVEQQTEVMKPVVVSFNLSIHPSDLAVDETRDALGFTRLPPLLVDASDYRNSVHLQRNVSLKFKNRCGDDQRCDIDLSMRATAPTRGLVLGSSYLHASLTLGNSLEPAYSTRLNVTVPAGFNLIELNEKGNETEGRELQMVRCYPAGSVAERHSYVCDMGNPFPGESNRTYEAKFGVADFKVGPGKIDNVTLLVNVSSATDLNNETTPADNHAFLNVPLAYEVNLTMEAHTQPDQMPFDRSKEPETNEISYVYQIKSLKSTGARRFEFNITRVVETETGETLAKTVRIEANDKPLRDCSLEPSANVMSHEEGDVSHSDQLRVLQLFQFAAADSWWPFSALWTRVTQRTEASLHCDDHSPVKCVVHSCAVDLEGQDVLIVKLKVEFNREALLAIDSRVVTLWVATQATAKVTDLSYIEMKDFSLLRRHLDHSKLTVGASRSFPIAFNMGQKVGMPAWAVTLAVIVAALVLLIVVVLMFFAGMFDRKRFRPSEPDNAKDADKKTEL